MLPAGMHVAGPASAAPLDSDPDAMSTSRKRKITCNPAPHVCWGLELSGTTGCPLARPISAAFRQRFCTDCQRKGVVIPATRIRICVGASTPGNDHAGGLWNDPMRNEPWPAHRVVNQTAGSAGPKLVILRHATSQQLPGLMHLPLDAVHEASARPTAPPLSPPTHTRPCAHPSLVSPLSASRAPRASGHLPRR